MALQIRRGTNLERLLITPVQGELIYTTDTKKLYVGDGVTVGGVDVDTDTIPALENLTNVVINSPSSGQVLKFDGLNWINDTDVAAGASVLADLNDVVINLGTLVQGQILKYDGLNWVNDTDNTGTSINTINDIGDVSINSPSIGQVLKWNGAAWINDTDSLGSAVALLEDLTNVSITTPSAGQVLKYNGTNWINDADNSGTTINTIDDIGDVVITTATAGQVLKFDGVNWVNDGFAEEVQDIIGLMLSAGTQTNITVTYDDTAGSLSFASTDTGITSLNQDSSPTLGGNLTLNGFNITGTGDVSVVGSVSNGSMTLFNNEILTVSGPVTVASGLTIPPTDSPPLNPVSGQLAVADGIAAGGWDPAANGKETLVVYLGGSWVPVVSAP